MGLGDGEGNYDIYGSPGAKVGANVMMASNNIQLAVAKPKKQIVQSLDQKEKEALIQLKQDEVDRF